MPSSADGPSSEGPFVVFHRYDHSRRRQGSETLSSRTQWIEVPQPRSEAHDLSRRPRRAVCQPSGHIRPCVAPRRLAVAYRHHYGQYMKENVVLACECGSTLKMSSLSEAEEQGFEALFRNIHQGRGHQRVNCNTATEIRFAERQRRRRETSEARSRPTSSVQ